MHTLELEDSTSLSSRTSPFEMLSPTGLSTPKLVLDTTKNLFSPSYSILQTQSSLLHNDSAPLTIDKLNNHLQRDVKGCILQVGETLAAQLFPNEDFGFAINDGFVNNFCRSFINKSMLFDSSNFENEAATATFLNQVTTIAKYLLSMKATPLKPLHYFTLIHASKLLQGSPANVKPDITIVSLINSCIWQGNISWLDAHSIIKNTREVKPPIRMPKTVQIKSFMTFRYQPERYFLPFICITQNYFHFTVTDHTGQIKTNLIPFQYRWIQLSSARRKVFII
jgi:hypothetical protein